MPANVLQRELDAYADAIDKYNQQARKYTTAATKHNESIDAYKALSDERTAGNYEAFTPNVYYIEGGQLVSYASGIDAFAGNRYNTVNPANLDNYYVRRLSDQNGAARFVLVPKQKGDMPAPGEFTMAQPTKPGAAPTGTVGQMRRLDEPSLADVERVGDKGLISSAFSSAFNY